MTDNQSTTIEQLSKRPIGKEHRTGGFQLTLKRARNAKQVGKKWLQEVLFLDSTGEIPGEILLDKYVPLQTNDKVDIVICWLQDGEKGPKLYVEQWKQKTWTADEYEASKAMNNSSNEDETKWGKCRYGLVCKAREKLGFDEPLSDEIKKVIDSDVDYIIDGV